MHGHLSMVVARMRCLFIALHLTWDSSPLSREVIACTRKICRLLWPAFQRCTSGIRQDINTALGAVEPPIDVMQQDFWGVRNLRLEIAHPTRTLRERRSTSQRLLAIGRHDRRAGTATHRRIAYAPAMFCDKAGPPLR